MASWLSLALAVCVSAGRGDDPPAATNAAVAESRVYGEWRIRVRPDQGPAYNRLIEQSGLPLFREAGGRMVGWWNTLVGDLYEHVTIWEYDDMAAFERAIGSLSKNPAFARFVAARDPLLAGEESRFLRLARGRACLPALPDPAPFVVHEVHRVPLRARDAYLAFMTRQGLGLLKANGFRPAGPWVVDVGRWTEVTYLFRFESLAERERLIARFSATADGRDLRREGRRVRRGGHDPPAGPGAVREAGAAAEAGAEGRRRLLPHREELAPGFYAAGFSDRYRSANCGWVALGEETLLIDLPRGIPVPEFLAMVAATTGKPARTLVLTHVQAGDAAIVRALIERGITRVLTSPETRSPAARGPRVARSLDRARPGRAHADRRRRGPRRLSGRSIRSRPRRGAAVYVPGQAVLFGGPLVVHGPRAVLAGSDTALWVEALRRLEALAPARVVPGFGSWGGPESWPASADFWPSCAGRSATISPRAGPLPVSRDQVRLPADVLRLDAVRHADRRRHRARLPGADRPDRPVPRPRARPLRTLGRTPWS